MTNLAVRTSSLAGCIAALYICAASIDPTQRWFSIGPAALCVLAVSLWLAANHAFLVVRSAAFANGQVDGGRRWISEHRKARAEGRFAGVRPSRERATELAITAAALALSRRGLITVAAVAALSIAGALAVELGGPDLPLTAILPTALVLALVAIAGTVLGRSVLAVTLFGGRGRQTRPLIAIGRLPNERPTQTNGFPSVRALSNVIRFPTGIASLLLAIIAVVLAIVTPQSEVLGFGIGILLVQLAAANWILLACSQAWRGQLADDPKRQVAPITGAVVSRTAPRSFPRGTNAPTQRLLVDLVTPLGALSELSDLGHVLSDHRTVEPLPVRWTIVTEPDRVDAVEGFLTNLFDLHGCTQPGPKVRVLACEEPAAGPKRNAGASVSTAPFIVFVDSDDRIDLPRLVAAASSCLDCDKAFQSVHLHPFHILGNEGMRLRIPDPSHSSLLTHHHCARIWPGTLFRSGTAEYAHADFEDAILTARAPRFTDHCVHPTPETAFLTYADHRDNPTRLTRQQKDPTEFLRTLAQEALLEGTRPGPRAPSERETELVRTLIGRVAAEIAWSRAGTALEILETGLEEYAPYRAIRTTPTALPDRQIEAIMDGVHTRSRHSGLSIDRNALVKLIRTEFEASTPITTALSAAHNDADRSGLERSLALILGLLNVDTSKMRPVHGTPTIFSNLVGEDLNQAGRALRFFLRTPHFLFSDDRALPRGSVEVYDPVSQTRQHVGNFLSDRLMSSRLLRLWDRYYPSMAEVEVARSQVLLQRLRSDASPRPVRLIGTGPSSVEAFGPNTASDVTTICCNSWVGRPDILAEQKVAFVTAADPIFHAGPSDYARQFRADLTYWLRQSSENTFLTVARDIAIYLSELPCDVHDQIISVSFEPTIDMSIALPLSTGRVQPFPNVLTLLMFPLAEHLDASELQLFGFDGGAQGSTEYWKYAQAANYSEELQSSVRAWHPEFFRLDLDDYRHQHDEHVEGWIERFSSLGTPVSASAPSNIPAVDAAFRSRPLRGG